MDDIINEEFEQALEDTGFGLFNILIMALSFAVAMANIFATTVLSFTITTMCQDLPLSLTEKGYLNSITYWGMIPGGLIWAAVADTKGRRTTIIITHLLDAFFGNCAAFGQNVTAICIFKFFCGFSVGGGYTTFLVYLSEVNTKRRRTSMFFVVGIMLTTAEILLPLIAMLVLSNYWRVEVIGLRYTSWQLYMTLTTIPSMIVFISFFFLPESPKFDQTIGRNARAHRTFELISRWNNWKRTSNEVISPPSRRRSGPSFIKRSVGEEVRGFSQLFHREYIIPAFVVFSLDFWVMLTANSIRLWQPSLIASAEQLHWASDMGMCKLIDFTATHPLATNGTCGESENSSWKTYRGNLVVCLCTYIALVSALLLVHRIGPKPMLICSLTLTVLCVIALYFATSFWCLILLALLLSFLVIAHVSHINAAVLILPTQVRATFMFTSVTIGRMGSTIGNMVLPKFMLYSCQATFLWMAGTSAAATLVSLCVPNPVEMELK